MEQQYTPIPLATDGQSCTLRASQELKLLRLAEVISVKVSMGSLAGLGAPSPCSFPSGAVYGTQDFSHAMCCVHGCLLGFQAPIEVQAEMTRLDHRLRELMCWGWGGRDNLRSGLLRKPCWHLGQRGSCAHLLRDSEPWMWVLIFITV